MRVRLTRPSVWAGRDFLVGSEGQGRAQTAQFTQLVSFRIVSQHNLRIYRIGRERNG